MASIGLHGITKTFGDTRVLNGIDLTIADGEFLTLVGPSGCGKSTTLRIIAGLEAQTAGNVEIDEVVVNDVRPSRRDLAMVFQSYALYPHLTVRQNLATPLLLRDLNVSGSAFRCWAPSCPDAAASSRPLARRSATRPGRSRSSICWTASRDSSPAASVSGSPSGGRWCAIPPRS